MPITLSIEDGATLELGGMSEFIGSAYAPQVEVTQTATGHEVAITYDDADTGITTKTFDVADGADGYSPTATVTQLAGGATIRITDKDGTTTAAVHDGTDGQDGSDGADGFSPTVDVQLIEGGHEVTITDAQGPHSFDVMDGDPAEPGSITDAMLAPDGIKAQVAQLWGNQLKGTLSGELMQASDAYGAPVLSLSIDGKSTQAGTPTPDAPVSIESVDELALVMAGRNLLDSPRNHDVTTYGMTWHFDELGRFHVVSGTASSTRTVVLYAFDEPLRLPAGDYYFTFDAPKTASGSKTKGPAVRVLHADGTRDSHIESFSTRQASPVLLTLAEGDAIEAICFAQNSGTAYSPNYTYSPRLWPATSEDKGYEPYAATTVPLYDGTLRSLPDGTKDTLALTYLRPSTREGWAVYSRTLTALVGETTTAATDGITGTVGVDVMSTTGEIADGPTVLYKLATPVTTMLDPIELPVLPAPNATVWSDPTTGMQMEYVQDTNIVIASLEAAYADLATS